ncbi:site-specific integrase [Flavisolibacter nicotianae]|uniref:site-specific integrase n=1 Tax=Flavisolibacter nicotianae TaxID=2364882 RepID=UPI000EB554AD|nr:site-specific integrase [Flavisolibacter nicotianae]
MLEKSFGLLFYLKKPKNYQKGNMPIYMRITVDGTAKEISTSREWDPAKWNVHGQRAAGTKEESKALNIFLNTLQAKVYQARRQLLEDNKTITAELLKNILKGKTERAKMLMEEFHYHNEQVKSLIGKEYAPATLTRFKTTLEHTKSFMQWKYGLTDIEIGSIDFEFITEFEFWFKSVRRCGHNTTMKYLGNFRKVINRCIRNGWLAKDPFMSFKMTKREVEKEFLSEDELQRIRDKEFSAERLSQVRDIFLFCCFTGLAYADVKKLHRSEICIGLDGEKWIFTNRRKTDTVSRIPLLPFALEIIDRYADCLKCAGKGLVLPVPSNQKMNAYLKEIADVCVITKPLTSHIARHTFATTITLSNGVPIESVSKMLGHTNLRTTQHYAKILDRKVSDDMQALKQKLKLVHQKAS